MAQPTAAHPFRIRTITAFLNLSRDAQLWEAEFQLAGAFLKEAKQHFEVLGYEVQTLRITTQPFDQYLTATTQEDLVTSATTLEQLAHSNGVPLLSIGSSSNPQHLRYIPAMVAATSATSCSFCLGPDPSWQETQAAAEAVLEVARLTGGAGNFRFAVSANCPPGIPYFPVATAAADVHRSFALGTECDALLHMAFQQAVQQVQQQQQRQQEQETEDIVLQKAQQQESQEQEQAVPVQSSQQQHESGVVVESNPQQQQQEADSARSGPQCVLAAAAQRLQEVLMEHMQPLEQEAMKLSACPAAGWGPTTTTTTTTAAAGAGAGTDMTVRTADVTSPTDVGFRYLGLDTSLAPGLDTPALTASYELLGLGSFGGPGSLTVSGMITKVLKGLPLRKTGYCGLMLAVCEDQGLADAAAAGRLHISQLLQYSAVCGCGLDTVPVPGPSLTTTPTTTSSSSTDVNSISTVNSGINSSSSWGSGGGGGAGLRDSIAATILDTATLAFRLQKPLACRLLPIPGKKAGDDTAFTNPYLLNSKVMSLDT